MVPTALTAVVVYGRASGSGVAKCSVMTDERPDLATALDSPVPGYLYQLSLIASLIDGRHTKTRLGMCTKVG
ncbi:hypothetical protein MAR_027810 [Mya arenaria]|uniref:Uncharacterized protein n=1 Tax=Mya arenaria TaxID=6604 RepID=A0ABY7EWH2_MYAAR|nr:hypothetical protein MAR_027810 [Mya arenaria]